MNKVAWGAKVNRDFLIEVIGMCMRLGWTPEQYSHIMACMAFETGETFSPSITNAAGSGATGLIQFMPNTAVQLGTSCFRLSRMEDVHQLSYVEFYFKPYANRIKTLSDMYMAILLPKYISASDSTVLFNDGTVAYRQNSGLDKDNDGRITKSEVSLTVAKKLAKGFQEGYYSLAP